MTEQPLPKRFFYRISEGDAWQEYAPDRTPGGINICRREGLPENEPWIGLDGRFHAVDQRLHTGDGEDRHFIKPAFATDSQWQEVPARTAIFAEACYDVGGVASFETCFTFGEAPGGDYVNLDHVLIYGTS